MVRRERSFLRDDSGISLAETLITFPIVMLVFAAFVEFGYAMYQWNQTVKSLHFGARKAAVSDTLVAGFDPATAAAAATPADAGGPIPVGAIGPWSCAGAACSSALNRIVYGAAAATACQPVATARAMCHLNRRIGKANVVVTYEMSGLGYYGRPGGAVVTIRMAVQNITFDLPILGTILGLDDITIPAMPVTVTSEDLNTNSGA
jgi:Flp pilus assembly protein TadG